MDANVTVPNNQYYWTPSYLDYNMTVHRVDVLKNTLVDIKVVAKSPLKVLNKLNILWFILPDSFILDGSYTW